MCHSICTRAMVEALQRMGLSADEARQQVVDRRVPPRCRPGRPIAAPYVGNGNFICRDKADAKAVVGHMADIFERGGLRFGVETDGGESWATVGLDIRPSLKMLLNKPARIWKLRSALVALREQGRCSGDVMRVVAGHLTCSFLVFGPALSVLGVIFLFCEEHGDRVAEFGDDLQAELRGPPRLYPCWFGM